MNYHQKYLDYKTKYLNLDEPNNIIDMNGGKESNIHNSNKNRYGCDPKKPFAEICAESDNGIYKSKESCINDCEAKYINHNLIESKLKYETSKFTFFTRDLMDEHIHIYIKGGTVLGLKVLKMIYNYCEKTKKDFDQYFTDFLELGLIRDWDFVGYTDPEVTIDAAFRDKTDKIAEKYKLVPRAKTFILYQTKRPIQLDDQALFEIAILDGDAFADLEIPMTTMKVRVSRHNLKYIYMFANCFYLNRKSNVPIDTNIIKRMIKDMNIIIYPHRDGLFEVNKETFDVADLSRDMLDFIKKFSKNNLNLEQFLITQIIEPNRMFYRLMEKNIPKTTKISLFLASHGIATTRPTWLFDENYIVDTCVEFVKELGINMANIYKKNKNINEVADYIEGINLSRIQIEFDKFTENGGLLFVKIMFIPLYGAIGLDNLEKSDQKIKLVSIMMFLHKKKIFD